MGPHRTLTARIESLESDRVAPGKGSRWLAILCLLSTGCFLPPPAEDKPLTGELDDAFQVDSGPVAVAAAGPAGEVVGEPAVEATQGQDQGAVAGSAQETAPGAGATDASIDGIPGGVATSSDLTPSGPTSSDPSSSDPSSSDGAPSVEPVAGATPGDANVGEASSTDVASVGNAGGAGTETVVGAPSGNGSSEVGTGAPTDAAPGSSSGSSPVAADTTAEEAAGGDSAAVPSVSTDQVALDAQAAEAQAAETSVVEVQESTGTDLTPVADVTETVAPESEDFDAQAVERDPDVDRPVGAAEEFTPKEIQSTVDDAEASADPALANATASAGAGQPGSANTGEVGVVGEQPAARQQAEFPVRTHETDDGYQMTYQIAGPPPRALSTVAPEAGAVDRATVVFIHGWCGSGAQWRSQMKKLASDSVVLSFDLLGHGGSVKQGREEWTIARFGRDVAGIIEAEDLHDVILVGHAMGGQVALEVALRSPDRIAGIIGVESLHQLNVDSGEADAEDSDFEEYLAAFQNNFIGAYSEFFESAAHAETKESIRERVMDDAELCDEEVAIKLMKHFQTHDLKSVVRNIECPVRCINSSIFKTDVEGNRALLTGFDAVEMKGVGFWPHLESSESFHSKLVAQINAIHAPMKRSDPATITGLHPVLFADDIDALADFYIERLRFSELNRQPVDPEQPASLINLERDEWRLQLQSRASLGIDVPGAEDVTVGGRFLFFRVTDLAEEKRHLGQDLEFIFQQRTLGSKALQTVFRDPQRNVIVLEQPPRRPAAPQE